jgi:hypothetical protein
VAIRPTRPKIRYSFFLLFTTSDAGWMMFRMIGFWDDFIIYVDVIVSGEQGSGILPVALRFSQNLNETLPKVYFQ